MTSEADKLRAEVAMRSMRMAALVLVAGCKVVDAPESLEELMGFGFETFGEPRAMEATLDELVPLADANAEDLGEGYRVDQLDEAQLAAAGVVDVEVVGIVGAMGEVRYTHDVVGVASVATHHAKHELFENITAYATEDVTDRACFLAHTCESFEQIVDETAQVALLGASERHYTHTLMWVEHPTHGDVIAIRSLSPDPIEFSSNIVKVNQQYSLAYLLPEGDGTRRIEAFWVDAEVIGVDLPDSFSVDAALNQMGNQAARIDEILDAGPVD